MDSKPNVIATAGVDRSAENSPCPQMGESRFAKPTRSRERGELVGGKPEIILGKMLGISMSSGRKSDAAAYVDNDSAPYRHKGDQIRKEELKKTPDAQSLKVGHGSKRRMGEMRTPPMFSQRRAFGDWVLKLIDGLSSLIHGH